MYLYSNILGTFVFNQNLQIREKILFSEKDLYKYSKQLSAGEVLDTEKTFLTKFKNIKNLRQEYDEKAMEKVYKEMLNYRKEFYINNLLLTKRSISDAVTEDQIIAQASDSIGELNKTVNILVKRLREWYAFVLPEVEEKMQDHESFVNLLSKKSRAELIKEYKIKNTMGSDLKKEDEDEILSLNATIIALLKQKEKKEKYIEKMMNQTCPNLTEVAGSLIGAKLISLAGSLRNLVMMPASTIQLLGAEKALFRHMVNRSIRPPKHGVIIEHPLLQKTEKANRGKMARAMGDKIALAVKVDFFKGNFIGDKLRKELEDKFK